MTQEDRPPPPPPLEIPAAAASPAAQPAPRRPRPAAPTAAQPEDNSTIYWSLAVIMLGFFFIGLGWVLYADNVPWADADFYFRGAKFIAEGEGYAHPFKSGNPPTAFHPVGFPWLLAHVWVLAGIDTTQCSTANWPAFAGCDAMIQAGQFVNLTLATVNIGLVFALGTLIKNPRIGLLSAAIFAIIPSRLIYTSALMSEESFVTLVLLALIFLVLGIRRQDLMWLTAIGFGLAVAFSAFIRPLGIILLPLPLLLIATKVLRPGTVFVHLAVSSLVALVVLLPWTLRNHQEIGGWNLVSNNGGINLWIGCHLGPDGDLAANGRWRDWWSGIAPRSLNTADERANDREAQRLALECMRKEPIEFARLSLVKGVYTFQEDWTYVGKWALNYDLPESDDISIVSDDTEDALKYLSNSVYFVLLPLAAVGAVTTLLAPSLYRGILGASFAVLAVVPLVFFGEPRFHVPLFPMMSIWAAEGIVIIYNGIQAARRHESFVEATLESGYPIGWKEEPWQR